MIGVVDYGLGNLFSLGNALDYIGAAWQFVRTPEELDGCQAAILPGVGAFPQGMGALNELGFSQALRAYTKPLLGICLGMQLLFDESEEFGRCKGLGLIPGRVERLGTPYKIPHMGWNSLHITREHPLLRGVADGTAVYFVHSYAAQTGKNHLIASCDYGQTVTAAAAFGNVMGTQFHPEKSGKAGLAMLQNFHALCKE